MDALIRLGDVTTRTWPQRLMAAVAPVPGSRRGAGREAAAMRGRRPGSRRAAVARFLRPAAAASTAGLLAAFLAPVPASAAPSRPGAPQSGPPAPVLTWRSCDGGFQCATARVPQDYRHPHGARISIAVIRHLATDPARRLGSLFLNGNGPSEQIESFPADYGGLPAVVRARYNIVTFDPRGFGYSTSIRCFPTAAAEQQLLGGLPVFPVGASQDAAWERTWARFDALCATRNRPLLDHDTTADVARDMNLLRQAVGDPVLNFWGLSYGSVLGATYANLFPARVGRIVLDANVNPVAWTSGAGGMPTWLRQDTDQGHAASMTTFLDLCGQAPPATCAFSAGTPAATRAKWNTLLGRLRRHPVTAGTPPHACTYACAVTTVSVGAVREWQADASLLQQLWTASAPGRRPPVAASPAARALATQPAGPAAPAVYAGREQQLAVICADSPNPRNPGDYAVAARLAYARSGGFGLDFAWATEPCAEWPAAAGQDRYAGPWNRPTASPILLVGNTGDPVLPYKDSVAMSRDLARARLLTVDGYGHTVALNPSTCATDYEIRYLLTSALPPTGTVCKENDTPFPQLP
jgi:pimeloyl-ACP methyl ester carboxylesterase